jgi:hypothetical protein
MTSSAEWLIIMCLASDSHPTPRECDWNTPQLMTAEGCQKSMGQWTRPYGPDNEHPVFVCVDDRGLVHTEDGSPFYDKAPSMILVRCNYRPPYGNRSTRYNCDLGGEKLMPAPQCLARRFASHRPTYIGSALPTSPTP